ncbi:patatin-like phospholipase family protein [Rhizosphaericola mali]|uniref:Patatin-like phospholipase family protein n=1 Tax=Rhizosphaericola mali TaxID=2545455 RepID=A0A5P2G6M9_9BACT|nr:patatin-like phospholipase family protein [Rhizosphaericola mali]QES89592.1 patatin-like phospholipase family protein [Rhizosphaericola mali]
MYKIGYCLSGGGVRGIAHLGIIKALEEKGIKPDIISGTSAGAIFGAFYAGGFTPDQIVEIISKVKFLGRANLQFRKPGLFRMDVFDRIFKLFFPKNQIEALKIPFIAAATNINTGTIEYFNSGNLSEAIRASSCIPTVFQPVVIGADVYLDGGIMNNFPIEPLLGNCEFIVGSSVNSMEMTKGKIRMLDIIDRTFNLSINKSVLDKSKYCDLFFDPPAMMQFKMLDLKQSRQIFEYGYAYAKQKLNSWNISQEQ